MRPGLLEVAVTVSVWFSLVAPEVMQDRFTLCAAPFTLIDRLFKAFSVGVWLTAFTVTVNVREIVRLEVRRVGKVTGMGGEPDPKAAGVKLKLPLVFGLV